MSKAGMHAPVLGAHQSWSGDWAPWGCTALGSLAAGSCQGYASIPWVRGTLWATTSWSYLLDKNLFPLHSPKKPNNSQGPGYGVNCSYNHSNVNMWRNFLSWHPSSLAKHLPEKSHVTHRALRKEQCKPFWVLCQVWCWWAMGTLSHGAVAAGHAKLLQGNVSLCFVLLEAMRGHTRLFSQGLAVLRQLRTWGPVGIALKSTSPHTKVQTMPVGCSSLPVPLVPHVTRRGTGWESRALFWQLNSE